MPRPAVDGGDPVAPRKGVVMDEELEAPVDELEAEDEEMLGDAAVNKSVAAPPGYSAQCYCPPGANSC